MFKRMENKVIIYLARNAWNLAEKFLNNLTGHRQEIVPLPIEHEIDLMKQVGSDYSLTVAKNVTNFLIKSIKWLICAA